MTSRILIVGAGAVGGYFGGRLAAAGRDVTFLVRPARARAIEAEGLVIESPHGNLTLAPKLALPGTIEGPYDVIFLSLKGFALETALDSFAPAVDTETLILPVLNGMRHLDVLASRFGADAVVGGTCRIVAQLEEGTIRQYTPLQQIAYGELDGSVTPRISALDALFQGVGFDTTLSGHIRQDMWDKWVQLAALGAVTCLLGGPVGAVANVEGGLETALAIWSECLAIARASGYPPREAYVASVERLLAERSSTMTSSMYRDMRAGSPVEVEAILGDLIRRGNASGSNAPLLRTAAAALRVYAANHASR